MAKQQITKQAVDRTAEEYWAAYFGPYGKQWTRKIPRRVAQVIAQSFARTASRQAQPSRIVRGQIAPLGWAQTPTGGLTFEGLFRGVVDRGNGQQSQIIQGFCADFDGTGKLTKIEQLAA